MKFDCNINLEKFLTKSFKDCPNFQFQGSIVNFDTVRKHVWSQLRSVDGLKIEDEKLELYEFSTFRDLIELFQNQNITESSLIQSLRRAIEAKLFPEYREKLFESLLLLSILGIPLNGKKLRFKIIVCIEDGIFYDRLKRELKTCLVGRLQALLPSEEDKVFVLAIRREEKPR